jgi:hypothetical protein
MLAACLLTACAVGTDSPENSMGLDPATVAYQQHGYNDKPVEARLGPYRFRIPANYFRDQIGPDFQGNFSLLVQWPDLEPLPPGKRSGQDMATFDRQITITPRYVDRAPIETRLERMTTPTAPPDSPTLADPSRRLDLMLPQPERDGLTPYVVDARRLAAYDQAEAARLGVPASRTADSYGDWFVHRNADGKLLSLIRCDLEPAPGDHRRAGCTHDFVIPDIGIAVSMAYGREYLTGWRRIEDRARTLIAEYRID